MSSVLFQYKWVFVSVYRQYIVSKTEHGGRMEGVHAQDGGRVDGK